MTRSDSALTADAAASTATAPDLSQWQAPGPNDVRSPCPALNSLANHGILPRDGRNITLAMLEEVLPSTLNVGTDLAKLFYGGAFALGLTHDHKFDLDALDKHNGIEHDGSVSRADAQTGDNHTFNQEIFDSYMDHFGDSAIMTPAVAGKARMFRIRTEQKRNPEFKYGLKQKVISNGETSLIMGIFGDIDEGNANKEHVRIFFEQERLPVEEGWSRPTKAINILNVGKMTTKVLWESGETLEDDIVVTESAVHDALHWIKSHWTS